MNKGKIISFEGIDGSGKSSAAIRAKEYLEERGIKTLLTRQPGGTLLGEKIRDILKHHPQELDPLNEVMLLIASFHASNKEVIAPFLDSGGWVLMDRYTDSTIAYQCAGKGLDEVLISELIDKIITLKPSLTLYYDISPEEGLKRASLRGTPDNFEKKGIAFQEKIRRKFLDIAEKDCKRVKVINTLENDILASQELTVTEISKLL
jgi:dTMP kinase